MSSHPSSHLPDPAASLRYHRGIHYWAGWLLFCTFILLASGGLVTSKGAGMAVPDWPTTFGYNLFLFPISRWVGGVFYEHTHRLIASAIGLFTLILTFWLLTVEARRWVKILGLCAAGAVMLQGLLGGLRVTLYKDEIGVFHALLAQSFFVLLGVVFIVTGKSFIEGKWAPHLPLSMRSHLRRLSWRMLGITVLVFIQLTLGALMRHQHIGLAIPDFPEAYGRWWPDTTAQALQAINEHRLQIGEPPTTRFQIELQMVHRVMAVVLLGALGWLGFQVGRLRLVVVDPVKDSKNVFQQKVRALWGLVVIQAALGAWTVLSNKAADVATLHMTLGACILGLCAILTFQMFVSCHRK